MLRPPHDVERNGLVRVAAEASDFEVAVPSIECVAQRGRWLRPYSLSKEEIIRFAKQYDPIPRHIDEGGSP